MPHVNPCVRVPLWYKFNCNEVYDNIHFPQTGFGFDHDVTHLPTEGGLLLPDAFRRIIAHAVTAVFKEKYFDTRLAEIRHL